MLNTFELGKKYEDAVNELPNDKCIYFLFDYSYELDKRKISKIVLIIWCPLNAPTKQKVSFAFTKKTWEKKFKGIHKLIEADSKDKVRFGKLIDLT